MEHAPAARTTLPPSTSHRDNVWSSKASTTHGLSHRRRRTRPADIVPSDIVSSEARNRQAAVRIADMKLELLQLESRLAETATKQNELAGARRDSAASSTDDLPEVIFPDFEFHSEFEGTFGQPRRVGIMSELMAMCDVDLWDWEQPIESTSPPVTPQLTHGNGSSISTISTSACPCDLGISNLQNLNAFPSPPSRPFYSSCHRRDESDSSVISLASDSTTMHEGATILHATPLLLPKKSPNPTVVRISPPLKRDNFEAPNRRSEIQLRRSAGFWKFDPPSTSVSCENLRTVETTTPDPFQYETVHKTWPLPTQCTPSEGFCERSFKRRESCTLRDLSQITTESPLDVHLPKIASKSPRQQPAVHSSHRASYSWIPARQSSLHHDLKITEASRHHTQSNPTETTTESESRHASATDDPADPATPELESSGSDVHALSKPRRLWRLRRANRRANCGPKLQDRRPISMRRLPAWIRTLPLTPKWMKVQSSTLTDLGNVPTPATPLPRNRASADFQFERNLMAGLENSQLSSRVSMTSLSLRTVRTVRRVSRTSTVSSNRPTTAHRCANARYTKMSQHGFPLDTPEGAPARPFSAQSAAHRGLPSLAELA